MAEAGCEINIKLDLKQVVTEYLSEVKKLETREEMMKELIC